MTSQTGRLLQTALRPAGGVSGQGAISCLVLVFDVGIYLIEPADGADELRLARVPELDALPDELEGGAEGEPWWTLLGHPLIRAREELGGDGLRRAIELQFRTDDQNPKLVALRRAGAHLRVVSRNGALGEIGS